MAEGVPAPGKAEVNLGGWLTGAHFPSGITTVIAAGPLAKWGAADDKITTAVANTKFIQAYLESTATSGDNRGMYLRLYFAGVGGGGEALRVYSDIVGVACGTVHGAHISLGMGESTVKGAVTGLGVAMRATLGLPNGAMASGGTYAAIMAEIYSFGANSDAGAVAELSFLRLVNDGLAKDDVDDDAFLFSIQGFTAGDAKMYSENTSAVGTMAGALKIKIGANTRYIAVRSTIGT